ncbi:MAG TPA: HlyD family efflux transporter periplasmic adaptor subunit [Paludibaculum sp.]
MSSGGGTSASGGASAFRGATNRFGAGTTSSSSAKSSTSGSAGSSSSSASSGASSGGGGGGGGGGEGRMSGGMNDFMQVLQSVAKVGGHVKKGDQVAGFDTQYQLLRLDDYRATVEQDERTLRSQDATLDVQRKSYQQSLDQAQAAVEKAKLDIKTTPVRSQIDAETLKLALEEAQAQLKQIQTQIPFQNTSLDSQRRISELQAEQSKQELKRAEKNVEKMTVMAPMDGMLVMESMLRGSEFSTIQQGDQLFPGQMFARIVDPRSMLVAAIVNQADVEFIRVNAKANLTFDAYPGLQLPAHVVSIAAIPKPGGQRGAFVKEISVYLKLDQMDARVIPDLSVSVDVFVGTGVNHLVAPLESVFQDGQNAKPYVFVKAGERFEKREVEIALRNNIAAAVASGLKAGEVIALERPVMPGDVAPDQTAQSIQQKSLDAVAWRRQQITVGEFHVV